jgi:hypothetical protein
MADPSFGGNGQAQVKSSWAPAKTLFPQILGDTRFVVTSSGTLPLAVGPRDLKGELLLPRAP